MLHGSCLASDYSGRRVVFYPVISGYLLVRDIACHTSHPEPTLTGSNEVDVASKEPTSCSRDAMWKRLALRNVALHAFSNLLINLGRENHGISGQVIDMLS